MAVILTQRNMVCACEPLEQDTHVETWIIGSEQRHLLSTQTIDHYQEAVDWAVSIADQMERHIDILPIDGVEYLQRNRAKVEALFAGMTDQQRRELDQHAVNSMIEVMRDSPDWKVRADAYGVLAKLEVVK